MSIIFDLRGRLAVDVEPCLVLGLWPDKRRIPYSYSSHVRGWHPVRENHPAVEFESRLECRAIELLARYPELERLKTQSATVVYRCGNGARRYTPDLLVTLTSVPEALRQLGFGLQTFVEVKPFDKALRAEPNLRHRFTAIRRATGLPIVLITDWDLPLEEVSHVA